LALSACQEEIACALTLIRGIVRHYSQGNITLTERISLLKLCITERGQNNGLGACGTTVALSTLQGISPRLAPRLLSQFSG
jgi:hypothetical protein